MWQGELPLFLSLEPFQEVVTEEFTLICFSSATHETWNGQWYISESHFLRGIMVLPSQLFLQHQLNTQVMLLRVKVIYNSVSLHLLPEISGSSCKHLENPKIFLTSLSLVQHVILSASNQFSDGNYSPFLHKRKKCEAKIMFICTFPSSTYHHSYLPE